MKQKLALAAIAATVLSTSMADPAFARRHHYYRGHTAHYRCGGGNGAVGTVVGGAGGALIGNAAGGGVLGTVAGGVGGALLGRHLDKVNTRHRGGC